MKGEITMDEYKWFKDDFQNNLDNREENNESTQNADTSYNTEYFTEERADYNTSGNDYSNFSTYDKQTSDGQTADFYSTNIKPRKTRRVPVYALAIAIVLTAALSVAGSIYVPKIYSYYADKGAQTEEAQNTKKDSEGEAIVAQAVADGKGNKALTTPEIVDKVGPAVVGIINKTNASSYYGGYFGQSGQSKSSGSGVIISSDGYVVTNNHVVENAMEISVILNTNETYTAKVIGTDARTDLAVIKIEASELPYAVMGTSSDLRVGETAIAIGNPLGQEFAGTTTQGIISGLNRSVTIDNTQLNLIQTDAAINPGNSGGALVNAYGHLIGINTAKISSSSLEGLGFAIPIDEAKPIIKDLIDNGYVRGRPVIGIGGRAVTEADAKAYNLKVGVYVSSMTPNSPAYMAGVKIGDIIVECAGKKVTTVDEINDIKNKLKPGDNMKVKVYRQGEYKTISIILGEDIPSIQ